MLVFALLVLVGIVLLVISILYGTSPKTKHFGGWVTVCIIGFILLIIGWTGGLAIQDIEEEAVKQEYEYEYNYCPHCGEQLKED